MESIVQRALRKLNQHHAKTIVIGLTGQTGSGCSTVAELLGRKVDVQDGSDKHLPLSKPSSEAQSAEDRKRHIILDFAMVNWQPFVSISVTDVIASYLLSHPLKDVEEVVGSAASATAKKKTSQGELNVEAPWIATFNKLAARSQEMFSLLKRGNLSFEEAAAIKSYFLTDIPGFRSELRQSLKKDYVRLFQKFGDSIRRTGFPLAGGTESSDSFFDLMERVSAIVDALHALGVNRVVIDAIRNPFEASYFRQRHTNFYLVAVSTKPTDRAERLGASLLRMDIKEIDNKEYGSQGKLLNSYSEFVSQNIAACLQHADIHITNYGVAKEGAEPNLGELAFQLVKYVSLMHHPGLVTPTHVERCMQAAYAAKLNSGCISRQVGAVVTDERFAIRAVGWNDVPYGQVSCLLRRYDEFIDPKTKDTCHSFSEYETSDVKFRDAVKARYGTAAHIRMLEGLPLRFCFKDEYNLHNHPPGNNQVHTRSLHAEENAFLQISRSGGQGLKDGKLFSTASPCELCSKKAYQIGIKEIYYIDPYPGISSTHVLASGTAKPQLSLFAGAIGAAYHKLYLPLLAYKDQINAFALIPKNKV